MALLQSMSVCMLDGLTMGTQDYILAQNYVDRYKSTITAYRDGIISRTELLDMQDQVLFMIEDNCPSINATVINLEIILTW